MTNNKNTAVPCNASAHMDHKTLWTLLVRQVLLQQIRILLNGPVRSNHDAV